MKTKRYWLVFIVLSVTFLFFAGCGDDDDDITGPTTVDEFPDSITVVTMMQANPGMADAAEQYLLIFVANTRTESGAISYDLYRGYDLNGNQNDRSYFILHEIWRDQAAIDTHLATSYVQDLFAQAATYFVGGAFEVTTAEMDVEYPLTYNSSAVIVFSRMNANPGMEETAVEELKTLVNESRKEEGTLRYDLYRGREVYGTASLTILHEIWRDWDAIDYHMTTDHFTNFFAQVDTLFSEPIRVVISEMVSTPE